MEQNLSSLNRGSTNMSAACNNTQGKFLYIIFSNDNTSLKSIKYKMES